MASISGISGSITILKIFYFTLEQSIIVGYVNHPVYMYFILPHGLSDSWLHFSLNINSNSKKIIIPKKNMFIPIPHPFPFLFFSSSSMSLSSIQSPFRLHSIFLPVPLFPSLSFRFIHSTCARLSLSFLVAYPAPSFPFFHPKSVFSLLAPTSESRHHLSLSSLSLLYSLFVGTLKFPFSYSLLYLDSLILSFLSCLFVSLFLSLSSTFMSLPFALNVLLPVPLVVFLSLLLVRVFFFFSLQHSLSILHFSFPSILSLNFAALFPAFTLNLFLLHSSLTM
jgi:hypothetical protein